MARPGWYPDPAGTPATYRYWDGVQWSAVTTADPATPPPDGMAPPPPSSTGGYAAGMPPMPPTSGGPSGGGRGKVMIAVVALGLALVVAAVLGVLGVRALGDVGAKVSENVPATGLPGGDELVPPPDESTGPGPGAAPGPPECRRGAPTVFDDQAGSDRVVSHGLSVPRVEGYQLDPMQSFAFTWAFDFVPQVQQVEQGWVSLYGVGAVDAALGSPEETAEAVMKCMTASPLLYSGFEDRKDLTSEKVDVAGSDAAWSITAEVRVDNDDVSVAGDVAQVIVVDLPDKAVHGLYISVVPIGDKDMVSQQEDIAGQLRVE